jgi:hypothetical protein
MTDVLQPETMVVELSLQDSAADMGADLLRRLAVQLPATGEMSAPTAAVPGVVVGQLVAIADDGHTPLVVRAGQDRAVALRARTVVDLQGVNVGHSVVLMFEQGDPGRPIVMGILRGDEIRAPGAPMEVVADGARMVVTAAEQLVLRCGKASITLTRAGKVVIDGAYVVSRSTGVNRIKGGSVQLN